MISKRFIKKKEELKNEKKTVLEIVKKNYSTLQRLQIKFDATDRSAFIKDKDSIYESIEEMTDTLRYRQENMEMEMEMVKKCLTSNNSGKSHGNSKEISLLEDLAQLVCEFVWDIPRWSHEQEMENEVCLCTLPAFFCCVCLHCDWCSTGIVISIRKNGFVLPKWN